MVIAGPENVAVTGLCEKTMFATLHTTTSRPYSTTTTTAMLESSTLATTTVDENDQAALKTTTSSRSINTLHTTPGTMVSKSNEVIQSESADSLGLLWVCMA